ncbi:hypothetical protein Hanom_Chr13g01197571 [Helianthus anomalus]
MLSITDQTPRREEKIYVYKREMGHAAFKCLQPPKLFSQTGQILKGFYKGNGSSRLTVIQSPFLNSNGIHPPKSSYSKNQICLILINKLVCYIKEKNVLWVKQTQPGPFQPLL